MPLIFPRRAVSSWRDIKIDKQGKGEFADMKFNKRVLAVLMAVLLMIPSMPISATGQAGAETVVQEVSSEKETVPEKE